MNYLEIAELARAFDAPVSTHGETERDRVRRPASGSRGGMLWTYDDDVLLEQIWDATPGTNKAKILACSYVLERSYASTLQRAYGRELQRPAKERPKARTYHPTAGDPWTKKEDELLRQAYRKGGRTAACAAIPWRTPAAIATRASYVYFPTLTPKAPSQPYELREQTEVIIGYRVWRVISNGRDAILRSIVTGRAWLAGAPMVAHRIERGVHDTGIHAYSKPVPFSEYGYYVPTKECEGESFVHGSLSLWGRVIEHQHGYRAEFAYPRTIYVSDADLGRAIARSYGCEVRLCQT